MSDNFTDFLNELSSGKQSKDLKFDVFTGTDLKLDSYVPYGIPTRIPALDLSIGRPGWPAGRIIEMFGFEHCIDSETFIHYQTRHKTGRVQNCKGGTIETLYHNFHRIPLKGQGKYLRKETSDSEYWAPCMTDEGYILNNKIVDVVDAGIQFCYKLTTKTGLEIIATEDHKFFTGTHYTPLKELNPEDTVFVSTGKRQKGRKKLKWRPDVYIKHHPIAKTRIVAGKYKYKRLDIARAYYESYINNLSYEDYIARLNSGNLENLVFLDAKIHIHHIDEDFNNNTKNNLQALTVSEHTTHHAKENLKNLSFLVSEDIILSVIPVGYRKVYDIKMLAPRHNYVANKFVVHNSGKSSGALAAVASCQRLGGIALYIDTERTYDPSWARLNGVDPEKLIVGQTDTIEGIFSIQARAMEARMKTGDLTLPFITVADSVTAVPSLESAEKDFDEVKRLGTDARSIRDGMRNLNAKIAESKTTAIYVNHNIAKTAATPFAKQSTSAGGHAIKFFASLRMEFISCGMIKSEKAGQNYREGIKVKVKVEKNKICATGKPEVDCELLNTGFDITSNLFQSLVDIGEIVPINNRTFSFKIPSKEETVQLTKAEWPKFIAETATDSDKVYQWFLLKAQEKGFIKPYNG